MLCQYLQHYPVLYDPTHGKRHDVHEISKAYKELAEVTGTSVHLCRYRVINILEKYRTEIDKPIKSWFCFKMLNYVGKLNDELRESVVVSDVIDIDSDDSNMAAEMSNEVAANILVDMSHGKSNGGDDETEMTPVEQKKCDDQQPCTSRQAYRQFARRASVAAPSYKTPRKRSVPAATAYRAIRLAQATTAQAKPVEAKPVEAPVQTTPKPAAPVQNSAVPASTAPAITPARPNLLHFTIPLDDDQLFANFAAEKLRRSTREQCDRVMMNIFRILQRY